jgi:hypothetical protein
MRRIFQLLVLLAALVPLRGQGPANGKVWRYQLLDGSAIMDECMICGRPSFWVNINGSFDLAGTTNAGVYRIERMSFGSDYSEKPGWRVTGSGTVDFSSGSAELTADITIVRDGTSENIHLTNSTPDETRIFPMLAVQGFESPATLIRVYRLRLNAAPIQEVWFSTTEGVGEFGAGDLLSNAGRRVKSNAELTEKLSLMEPGDVSLDAVDIGSRGEIFFSTKTNAESFVNGTIGHGDIVTSGGRVYLQNAQLLAAFGVDDPEAGLDALHIVSEDEVLFSISKEVTRSNGAKLRSGDILSNKGRIERTEAALLLRFQNPLVEEIGVDALYRWPNGEIWFSTEKSFTSSSLGLIDSGDVISDQGYVAFRSTNLVARLAPTAVSPGLDALTIISDASVRTNAGQIVEITVSPGAVDLRWESSARVFRVEKAGDVEGPWQPASEIIIERAFNEPAGNANTFYRVREW